MLKNAHAILEEKQALLHGIIEGYNRKITAYLQAALKDLLSGAIQYMLEGELKTQMLEREAEDPTYHESRNGYKTARDLVSKCDYAIE